MKVTNISLCYDVIAQEILFIKLILCMMKKKIITELIVIYFTKFGVAEKKA